MGARERLEELGITLPNVATPAASYQPYRQVGSLVYTAGQVPVVDGKLPLRGKLGAELEIDDGIAMARICGLNLLAIADAVSGDLDRVRMLKLTVFVACDPSFGEAHLVANGASDLLVDVLGDNGVHSRSAVGMSVLPKDAPVEAEAVFELLDG